MVRLRDVPPGWEPVPVNQRRLNGPMTEPTGQVVDWDPVEQKVAGIAHRHAVERLTRNDPAPANL